MDENLLMPPQISKKKKKKKKRSKSRTPKEEQSQNSEIIKKTADEVTKTTAKKMKIKKKRKIIEELKEEKLKTEDVTKLAEEVKELRVVLEEVQMWLKQEGNPETDLMERKLNGVLHSFGNTQLLWRISEFNAKYANYVSLEQIRRERKTPKKFLKNKMGIEYARMNQKTVIFSPPFSTNYPTKNNGYRLIASLAPYGDGAARGKYMSLFVSIIRTEYDDILLWPFHHRITLILVDQTADVGSRKDVQYVLQPNLQSNLKFLGRPTNERNPSFGAQNFVDLKSLKNLEYIKDDMIFIKVHIDE